MATESLNFKAGDVAWATARKHIMAVESLMRTMVGYVQHAEAVCMGPDEIENLGQLAIEEIDRAHDQMDLVEQLMTECRQKLVPEEFGKVPDDDC